MDSYGNTLREGEADHPPAGPSCWNIVAGPPIWPEEGQRSGAVFTVKLTTRSPLRASYDFPMLRLRPSSRARTSPPLERPRLGPSWEGALRLGNLFSAGTAAILTVDRPRAPGPVFGRLNSFGRWGSFQNFGFLTRRHIPQPFGLRARPARVGPGRACRGLPLAGMALDQNAPRLILPEIRRECGSPSQHLRLSGHLSC
jgi:hypothetical protein